MKNIIGICIIILTAVCLSSCEQRPSKKVKVTVISVSTNDDGLLGCGLRGVTIVQTESGERHKWCGVWGKPGDVFMSDESRLIQ
jgi:hypothetical protein